MHKIQWMKETQNSCKNWHRKIPITNHNGCSIPRINHKWEKNVIFFNKLSQQSSNHKLWMVLSPYKYHNEWKRSSRIKKKIKTKNEIEKNNQNTKLHKKTKLQQIVIGLNGDAQDWPTWNNLSDYQGE